MPAVYLTDVAGDGVSSETAFRPSGFDGIPYVCLMIHETKRKALVASPNTVTGAGTTKLLAAASWPALRTLAKTTNPTANQLNAVKAWLATNGYPVPVAVNPSWWEVIHHVARQVNPSADLDATEI